MRQFVLGVLVIFFPLIVFGQGNEPSIGRYVTMVETGEEEAVRAEIGSLSTKYPNHPGVLYLQGLLAAEGAEAVRIYQSIVDNHPMSEWADDALHKIYQFYYALGLYRTAELKMNQLKKEYPSSRYASGGSGVSTKDLPEEEAAPAPEPATQSGVKAAQGQFTLQVGAYSTMENAEKQKLFFEDLGYPVEVTKKVRDGRSLFVVNIGSYATYDDAKARGTEIKKTYNIDSFVVTR